MSQGGAQHTQIGPHVSQMITPSADFTARQQLGQQMGGNLQSSSTVLPPNNQGQRSVSFAEAHTTTPYDQVTPGAIAPDVMSAGVAGAATPTKNPAAPLHTEAEVTSKVSFRSLHPAATPKL